MDEKRQKMKIKLAHLFLVRSDLNQESLWKRFFSQKKDAYSIYVHAKWPQLINSTWLREKLIPDHCKTEWGKPSLVRAEELLLRTAFLDNGNKFFLLHSESCVPLRSYNVCYNTILGMKRSWVHYYRGCMERYQGVNQAMISREHFYKSSQFFCLTRNHVEVLLNGLKLCCWERCECPDEHFVPTTLSQFGELSQCLGRSLTFTHWPKEARSPFTFHTITEKDLSKLRMTPALFARKFAVDSDIAGYFPIFDASNQNMRFV